MKIFFRGSVLVDFCPTRSVFDRIGDKWAVMVLLTLGQTGKPTRYNELQEAVGGISQKMLTATLKNLVEDGLVSRQMYPEIPPRVDYALTEKGLSLLPHLYNLAQWANEHAIPQSTRPGPR